MAKKRDPEEVIAAWLERDLTEAARGGELAPAYRSEEHLDRLEEVLAAGKSPVLTGDSGVGKTAIVCEAVRRASEGRGFTALAGKRVLQLSIRRCTAALPMPGAVRGKAAELVDALATVGDDVVPYFRDFHLAWNFDLEPHFESMVYRLDRPVICEGERGAVRSILEYEPELEQQYIVIDIPEPDLERARAILTDWAEDQAGVRFERGALETALELSHRFLARGRFPRKALEPLRQLAALVANAEGADGDGDASCSTVSEADVIDRFCRNYHLPRFLVDPSVRLDLDELEETFRARVLGQDEAVDAMIRMISRIKAGLIDPRRPFGVFLFVGPTGVGKTHLAQLIAETLLGSPDRMVRLNMADFHQEKNAESLFGDPDDHRLEFKRGLLTKRVMGHPFAILLLDEFEKASDKVHDRFLQLFDEGRFINGAGESISCRSLIIVVTSNAGAELYRGGALGFLGSRNRDDLRKQVDREIGDLFRFEFLNRFDHIVHFHPLSRREIRTIALRELGQLENRTGLRQRDVTIEIDETLLDWLAVHGYDPDFGARFLRRTIEREVSTALADLLVRRHPTAGSRVAVGVRANRVHASLVDEPRPERRREAVSVPRGRAEEVKHLGHAALVQEGRAVLAAAKPRLDDLDAKRREYDEILHELNDPSFWQTRFARRDRLARFRELDVAIGVESRLAARIERLAGRLDSDLDLERIARSIESAARALREWNERSAGEASGAVWLVVSRVDPLRPDADWIQEVVDLELAWCRRLQLESAVVAYALHGDDLARVVLEVSGPGAAAYLEMECGVHRRHRARKRDARALIEVIPVSDVEAADLPATRQGSGRRGRLGVDRNALGRLELEDRGQLHEFVGEDPRELAHFLHDYRLAAGSKGDGLPPTARHYGEDGAGARDPRTGEVLPRLKDALRGRLDGLLEGWRRDGDVETPKPTEPAR